MTSRALNLNNSLEQLVYASHSGR